MGGELNHCFSKEINLMSRKLQETQTTVRCTRCHEAFSLSADDSILFLRNMQIDVECPICVQLVHISVIPSAAGNHSGASYPANSPGQSRGLVKPNRPSGQTKVGLPPFKPLGRQTSPSPAIEASRSIPFAPIQTGIDKPRRNVSSPENTADQKGWWRNQNKTTKVLIFVVGFMFVALAVLAVLLMRKPAAGPGPATNPKQRTEIPSGASHQPGSGPNDSGIRIPTEDSFSKYSDQKSKD